MNHIVTAITPLDPELLRFRSLRGSETLSSLYAFEVELVSPSPSIDMTKLLGKPLALQMVASDGSVRHLGGEMVRGEFTGRDTSTSRSYLYTMSVRPWLWYLTKTTDSRIFQNQSVVEILREVFAKYPFEVEERLVSGYRQWTYCVQYEESDFAFVSRLMELEGIYYYFRHEAHGQVLVLSDDVSSHDPLAGGAMLPWQAADRLARPDEDGIDHWRPAAEISTGVYTVDDYDFRKPRADLLQRHSNPLSDQHGHYAHYRSQGSYIEAGEGEHYARVRLEEEQAQHARVRAHTHFRAMAPGYVFTLTGCPRLAENRGYLIVGVTYRLEEAGYASGSGEAQYDFEFVAQPAALPFRAPSRTPVPRATGPQTAVVVGPQGQTIWTDQYGRVKLQFHWDRYGRRDENSSCWVRVSDAWAGTNYGGIHIPRIGQEVVVDFINGDFSRPIVTGRVYNADQMPPFKLPEAATQSGFVTRTPGGTAANANMLRFEDKAGAEQVLLHAERNLDVSVEKDASEKVAANKSSAVGGDNVQTVAGSSTSIVEGNSTTIIDGVQTLVVPEQIAIAGLQHGFTGIAFGHTGSAMSVTGSVMSMTGSAVSVTGSAVSVTGSAGNHVGFSATF